MNRRHFVSTVLGAAAAAPFVQPTAEAVSEPLTRAEAEAAIAAATGPFDLDPSAVAVLKDKLADLAILAPQDMAYLADRYAKQEQERLDREAFRAHYPTCQDCRGGSMDPVALQPVNQWLIMSSRALWLAPAGTSAVVGRGGQRVERVLPFFYDVCTDEVRKDQRAYLAARIRCRWRPTEGFNALDVIVRPDGDKIIRGWVPIEREHA